MSKPICFLISFLLVFKTLAEDSPYRPKLVNSKSGEHHDFPLGVLEATGRLQDGDREILIMDVGKGGAAELAGLQVGDRITKIENKIPDKFSKKTDAGLLGPQDLLGRSLDEKAGSSNSELSIEVARGQNIQKLNIRLPASLPFSFSDPESCEKEKDFFLILLNNWSKPSN